MNIFQNVKEAVSTRDAASFYGVKVNRNGMCRCPFHNDRNPSMKIGNYFYCFGCGEKGDVITFVSKLFNLSAFDAAKKLLDDFGINHATGKNNPASASPHIQNRSAYDFQKAFTRYAEDTFLSLLEYRNHLLFFKSEYDPKTPEEMENCNPLYEEALMNLDKIEWMLDQLTFENTETQINFMNTYKGELENVKKRNNEFRTE